MRNYHPHRDARMKNGHRAPEIALPLFALRQQISRSAFHLPASVSLLDDNRTTVTGASGMDSE
jgi:hypothetical protein